MVAAGPPLLSADGLHSGYGRIPILGGVSLSVRAGEFVGILGHNGMGKTTLLRTLMGYLPATAGQVRCDGADVTRRSPTARAQLGIGYVPQGREIFPALSVRENLRMGCLLSHRDEDETIAGILQTFPRLKAYLDRPAVPCRGASSSSWRWRAACAATRASSSSTSRRKASNRRSSRRSSKPCSGSGASAASPCSSWSRT